MSRSVKRMSRRGHTLLELVVSISGAGLLMVGLASSLFVAITASQSAAGGSSTIQGKSLITELFADIQYAKSISEKDPNAITVVVPDRDADMTDESIRYSWTGVAGAPILREYNGGEAVPVADNVYDFTLGYQVDNPLINSGFESDTANWTDPDGNSDLVWTSSNPGAGTGSLLVDNRTSNTGGPFQDVSSWLASGKSVSISLLVRGMVIGENVTFGIKIIDELDVTQTFSVTQWADTTWTPLAGTVTPTWSGSLNSAWIFVNTSNGGSLQDLGVDEFEVQQTISLDVSVQVGSDAYGRLESSLALPNKP